MENAPIRLIPDGIERCRDRVREYFSDDFLDESNEWMSGDVLDLFLIFKKLKCF